MKNIILILILLSIGNVSSAIDPCNCQGYSGPGGPCYTGPGGNMYSGPGGNMYA